VDRRTGNSYVTLVTGLSQFARGYGDYRAVLFWLLLLGSWQFLAVPGTGNTLFGAAGTAAFLILAWRNLGRLEGLGLGHAAWRPATKPQWLVAGAIGLLSGAIVFGIASASRESLGLTTDRGLLLLQVTLGPVLEEIVFRGYLFALLTWCLGKAAGGVLLRWLVSVVSAVLFAAAHSAQPGVGWLQLACIASTGLLYGCIRSWSESAAPPAICHAFYNLTLYAGQLLIVALRPASGFR